MGQLSRAWKPGLSSIVGQKGPCFSRLIYPVFRKKNLLCKSNARDGRLVLGSTLEEEAKLIARSEQLGPKPAEVQASISSDASSNQTPPKSSKDQKSKGETLASKREKLTKKAKELGYRVASGTVLGLAGAGIILYGKWAIFILVALATFQASQEYHGLINGITKDTTSIHPLVTAATTALSVAMTFICYWRRDKGGLTLAVSTFLLLVIQVIVDKKPKFSQMSSSIFGLLYCGWLPSFWLRLRLINAPAPVTYLLTLLPHTPYIEWSVGLAAMLTAVVCIVAADTGAYFVGKSLGRTKLTDISPKKTVEGAAGGLASSVVVALLANRLCPWLPSFAAVVGFGVLMFISSLFGDLIESIMKRDAEMKDSGNLIPGHGGLLDRFDSYMFSGAVAFFYIEFCLPHLLGP